MPGPGSGQNPTVIIMITQEGRKSVFFLCGCLSLYGIYVYSRITQKENNEVEVKDDDCDQTCSLPSHVKREMMKDKRRREKIPELAMKTQMYDNIDMTDEGGELLCKISKRKAAWYIKKGLAHYSEDMSSIRLKFKPKVRTDVDESSPTIYQYTKAEKANICVSCGVEKHHQRFYICPYVYRSLMPQKYKSHQSHDIVILCHHCHLDCEQFYLERVREIEDRYEPPTGYEPQFLTDTSLKKVRSSALALLNWSKNIPKEKLEQHEQIVRCHLLLDKNESLTTQRLQDAIDVDFRTENQNFISKPEIAINTIASDDEKLTDFIKGWRQFFLDTMNPRFMPEGWSVNNPVRCDSRGE